MCLFFMATAHRLIQHKMNIQCLDESSRGAHLVGIEWYTGSDTDADVPTLAVAYDNGRIQIMRNQYDESTRTESCPRNVL